MSNASVSGSDSASDVSASENESTPRNSSRKKSSKVSKPRLTASQKNTNHKDAENKRRNAIRERFTDLSKMVPGAEGQERSEQVMLNKTTDYLRDLLAEQRQLEAEAERRGLQLDEKSKLRSNDYGGPDWRQPHMDAYHSGKAKKTGNDGQDVQALKHE